jgi:uncharacterized protein
VSSDLTESELEALRDVFEMARTGELSRIRDLVQAGLPVNLTNGAGDTLLMLAAYHRHPELVAALLDWGADTSRVNDRGQTGLGAAVFRRSTASVEALLRAGADPSLGPRSALEVAEVFELPDMLALLTRPQHDLGESRGD